MKRYWPILVLSLLAAFAYAETAPVSLQSVLKAAPKADPVGSDTHLVAMKGSSLAYVNATSVKPPIASAFTAGIIKVGTGLSVDGNGVLNNTGLAGVASFNGRAGAVKPGFNDYSASMVKGLATVAKTGAYSDLTGKPTIPAAQVNSDWSASSGVAQILNKPTIPTALSQLTQSPSYRTVTDTEKATWNTITASVNSVNGQTGSVTLSATDVGADPLGAATSVQSNLSLHEGLINNPHQVTKAQVGLGSVDNTSDANKPVSTAMQTALNLKANTASLGTAAAKNVGTAAGDVASGIHASTHATNGSDPITPAAIGAATAASYIAPTSASDISVKLTVAAALGGGTVHIPAGTYSTYLTIPDNVSIEGEGRGVTVLKLPDHTTQNVVSMGNKSRLAHLTIDGNKTNQTNAEGGYGVLTFTKTGVSIEDVEVKNTNGIGIGVHTSPDTIVSHAYVHDTLKYTDRASADPRVGIWIYAPDLTAKQNVTIDQCDAYNNGLDGVIIDASGVSVIGGFYTNNGLGMPQPGVGAAGVYVSTRGVDQTIISGINASKNTGMGIDIPTATTGLTITGNVASGNNNGGIVIAEAIHGVVSGNIAFNNGQNAQVSWQDAGIAIKDSDQITVTGNSTYDSQVTHTQYYGLLFEGTIDDSLAVGNNGTGNTIDYSVSGVTGTGNNFVSASQMRDATKIQGTAVTGVSGSGGVVATTTGTPTNGNCAKWVNGNVVDAGAACGTATGTGNMTNTGASVATQIPKYTDTTGTALSPGYTVSGSGASVATTTGAHVSGNCAKWDVNGNVIDAGAACGSGSSSGNMVNTGTSAVNQIPKYTDTTGTALAPGFTVGAGANNLLQLDASSRLLLGAVATPAYTLDMDVPSGGGARINAATGQATIHLAQAGTDNGQIVAKGGAGTDIAINGTRYLYLQTAGVNRATIMQDGTWLFGNVAIAQSLGAGGFQFSRDQTHSGLLLQAAGTGYFPYLALVSANGTLASPTATTSGKDIGELQFAPYTGAAYAGSVFIKGTAAENWTTSAQGFDVSFFTRPVGSNATPTERMKIGASGGVSIGSTTDPGAGSLALQSDTPRFLQIDNGAALSSSNPYWSILPIHTDGLLHIQASTDGTTWPDAVTLDRRGILTLGSYTDYNARLDIKTQYHATNPTVRIGGSGSGAYFATPTGEFSFSTDFGNTYPVYIVGGTVTAKAYTEGTASASGTAYTWDVANGGIQRINTTGNTTITITALTAGKSGTLNVCYGGTHTITWAGATVKWFNGVPPAATSVNGKCDKITCDNDGTDTMCNGGGPY